MLLSSMTRGQPEDDRLSRWLAGDGLSTLDGIMGEALDVIGVVDRELTIRYLNWTVPGLERERLVGRSVLELVPPAFVEMSRDTYLTVLRTGIRTRFETIYRDSDNVLVWEVRVGPIRCAGEIIGLILDGDPR